MTDTGGIVSHEDSSGRYKQADSAASPKRTVSDSIAIQNVKPTVPGGRRTQSNRSDLFCHDIEKIRRREDEPEHLLVGFCRIRQRP